MPNGNQIHNHRPAEATVSLPLIIATLALALSNVAAAVTIYCAERVCL